MKSQDTTIFRVVKQHLCNSCGACFVVCQRNAIKYTETIGGYFFPEITEDCVECGMCTQVCPGINFGDELREKMPKDPFVGDILSCYVGRAINQQIFLNSQSGGGVTALLKKLIDNKQIEIAIVAIMKEGFPPRGDVIVVKNVNQLLQSQKSKYTPIPILKVLKEIIPKYNKIAIVGLPCHMHGLHNLIQIIPQLKKKEFFKIGLICDRVLTTTAIDFIGSKATKGPFYKIIFRDKLKPSYPGNPVVLMENGVEKVLKSSLRIIMKDFFTPVRCRLCFDKLNVFADIVFGDPHGIDQVDRLHGESLVLIRTRTGNDIVEKMIHDDVLDLRKISRLQVIDGQRIEQKRIEWAKYMTAWEKLGRQMPYYGFSQQRFSFVYKQRREIIHALALDSFSSSVNVLKAAEMWFFKKMILKKILFIFVKIKKEIMK